MVKNTLNDLGISIGNILLHALCSNIYIILSYSTIFRV